MLYMLHVPYRVLTCRVFPYPCHTWPKVYTCITQVSTHVSHRCLHMYHTGVYTCITQVSARAHTHACTHAHTRDSTQAGWWAERDRGGLGHDARMLKSLLISLSCLHPPPRRTGTASHVLPVPQPTRSLRTRCT